MRQLCKLLFVVLSTSAYAEDMIDPSLITPIECKPVVETEIKVEVKPEIKTTPITNFGYVANRSKYSFNDVQVGTYVLVDIDGVYYRKYMVFSKNRWTEILIKD